ncbi:NAD(P)/FAD-dependent oxidoreductase [Celeribacter persicus]|uniref:3-phenylpropionate/trans-cinnamate dioxygenase ferredoxin reductase subunit n=1 Tax=Celeribacter persicus TaxID=1651082 RepID=A0A2T5HKA0_9RHOB|nr:FAD/NAD(P)-binding oxidoreductase [Celeribacter persicus]PTQ72005.1 3-phenylpropionate/trans-cinnamate dioxygenase ferredoxin reductase subunit [Celeribacter persicus]
MAGIVIIGAGHGGTQLAVSLREEGYEGPVTVISADPDHPYHKPPLSKSFMKTPDAALQPLRAPQVFADQDIDLRLGVRVETVDRANKRLTLSDGTSCSYDKLVLATGTEARKLTVPGGDLRGVFTLRTAEDARALRAALPEATQVVVIGGGFIGLEAAAMLAGRGLSVSVVELAPRLLGRAASAGIAFEVETILTGMGVQVRTGTELCDIVGGQGQVTGVRIADETLPADLVIVGIGALPVDDLARAAGLEIDNGIAVNAVLQSSDPEIYALGDCASFPDPESGERRRLESVQNATDQARALAKTLAGRVTPYAAVPWFWSDIGAMKLQIAGLLQGAENSIESRTPEGRLKSVYHLKAGRLVAVETINSAGEHMLARQMLAAGFTPEADLMRGGDPRQLKAAFVAAQS